MPIYPNDLDIPPFQFRRAIATTVSNYVPAQGEPVWSTDGQTLYVGDGTTVGGIPVGGVGFTATNAVVNKLVNGSYEVALNSNGTVSFPFGGTLQAGNGAEFFIKNVDHPVSVQSIDTGTKVGSLVAEMESATMYARDTSDGSNVEISTDNNDHANPVVRIKVQAAGGSTSTWTFNDDGTTAFPGFTFPYADGTSGQVLATNGSGTLAWTTSSGGGSNPFDQDLNTTNNVTFAGLTLTTQLVNLGLDATGNSSYSHQAIGFQANASGAYAVALGHQSKGYGGVSIAIGAGSKADGDASIAIGNQAGSSPSFTVTNASNSIIINASGNALTSSQSGFYVDPVRGSTSSQILYYDTTTKEITYGTGSGVSGNPFDQTLNTTSNVVFKSAKATQVLSAGGYPLDSNGQALLVYSNTQSAAMLVSNYTAGLFPTVQIRGWGSNRPSGPGASASGAAGLVIESSRGTPAAPTALQSADTVGGISMGGYDGTRWSVEANNQTTFQLVAQATETWASSGTTVTNAGTRFFIRTQPQGIQVDTTSRQIHQFQTWTAGSTSAPPQSNLLFGSGVDGSAPTLINSNGLNSHTGYGAANVNWINTKHFIIGTPGEETFTLTGSISGTTLTVTAITSSASVMSVGSRIYSGANSYGFITAQLTGTTGGTGTYTLSTSSSVTSGTLSHGGDNTTLATTNYLLFSGARKSGVSGRRNKMQVGDTLGQLLFYGQTSDSGTTSGVQSAAIVTRALDTFSGSAQGSRITFFTANSGTTYASGSNVRLELKNRENLYQSDIHTFKTANAGTSYMSLDTNGMQVGSGGATAFIASANAYDLVLRTNYSGDSGKVILNNGGVNLYGGSGANTQVAAFTTSTINLTSNAINLYGSGSTQVASFATSQINLYNNQIAAGDGVTAPRIQGRVGLQLTAANANEGAELGLSLGGAFTFNSSGTQVAILRPGANEFTTANNKFGDTASMARVMSNGNQTLRLTTDIENSYIDVTTSSGIAVYSNGNVSLNASAHYFSNSAGSPYLGIDSNGATFGSGSANAVIASNGNNDLVLLTNGTSESGIINVGNGVGEGVIIKAGDKTSPTTVASFTTATVTMSVPVVFPSYTATAANAITGSLGMQICISNSGGGGNPNGMMAFWDTTNSRWSYIHDNTAV